MVSEGTSECMFAACCYALCTCTMYYVFVHSKDSTLLGTETNTHIERQTQHTDRNTPATDTHTDGQRQPQHSTPAAAHRQTKHRDRQTHIQTGRDSRSTQTHAQTDRDSHSIQTHKQTNTAQGLREINCSPVEVPNSWGSPIAACCCRWM